MFINNIMTIVLKYYPFEPRRYAGYGASINRVPTMLREAPQIPSTGVKLTDAEIRQATLEGGARESVRLRTLSALAQA
jgi:hypothetical protein